MKPLCNYCSEPIAAGSWILHWYDQIADTTYISCESCASAEKLWSRAFTSLNARRVADRLPIAQEEGPPP